MIVSIIIDSRKYSFVHIVAFMDFCAVTPKSITIKHSLSHSLSSLFSPYLALLSLSTISLYKLKLIIIYRSISRNEGVNNCKVLSYI